MKKNIVKVALFILVVGVLAFLIIKFRVNIVSGFLTYYQMIEMRVDKLLFAAINICIYALLGIVLCLIMAKIIDKVKHIPVGKPLSETHSILNLIIALLMLVIMGVIACTIIFYIFRYMGTGLANITSKMDAVVIVALITGMVSIIGVIISSVVAKIIDYKKGRQEYLAKKREEPYGEFVEMIYKIQQNSKKKGSYTEDMMVKDLSKFSKQITLWGSPNVVNKWVKFRENGANPEAGTDNLFLMEEIMNEMRKDLGLKKVKKGNLLAFFVNDIKKTMKGIKQKKK